MDKIIVDPSAVLYDCLNTLTFASNILKDLSERLSMLKKFDSKLYELYMNVESHCSLSSLSLKLLYRYGLPKPDCKENMGCKK